MKRHNLVLKFAFVIILFTNIQPNYAQDKVGASAASFLGINIGTAASAMGGAYVSFAKDASALYWNPGAISRLGHSHLAFMHTKWFVDTEYNWGGIIYNFGSDNAIGIQMAVFDTGEEEVTTVEMQDGTGERWSALFSYAAVSYARNLTNRFSIGGSVKIIQEKIYHESATGYAFDLGLLYITRFNGMRLGVSISNFGTNMQMDGKDLLHTYDEDPDNLGNNPTIPSKLKTEEWPLPLFFRVGISMEVLNFDKNTLSVATDALVPSDNNTVLNVGVEYNLNENFFLRGGYKSIMRERKEEGLTAGVGFKYFVPGLANVNLDYAFNDYGILGDIHIIGFGFSF